MKRAAEIAASGMHNLLISGPPGSGKSMNCKMYTVDPSAFDTGRVAGGFQDSQRGRDTSRGRDSDKPSVSDAASHGISQRSCRRRSRAASRGRSVWRIGAFCTLMSFQNFKKRRWRSFGSRWRTRRYGSQGAVELTYFLRISCLWHHGIPVNAGIIQTENAVPAGREMCGAICRESAGRCLTGLICMCSRSRSVIRIW